MDISKASHIDYVLFKTIEPLISKVVDELISSLDEYESIYEVNIPIAVLLCGGTALLKNVDRYIEKSLSLRSYLFQLPVSKKVNVNSGLIEELGSSFMVPLGLAISPFLKGIDPAELTKEPLPESTFEEEQEEEEDTRKEKKGFWSWFK
jgi:Tfp pilus assembly PilM family ATPase